MIRITVYKITGKQLFVTIPRACCEECDLSVQVVKNILKRFPKKSVKLVIKPWIDNFVEALVKGGWHAPVIFVGDKIFSQGVIPNAQKLEEVIQKALSRQRNHSRAK